MTPLIYLNAEEKYTLPIGLNASSEFFIRYLTGHLLQGRYCHVFRSIIILAVVGQKYFVKGLMAGAVKG